MLFGYEIISYLGYRNSERKKTEVNHSIGLVKYPADESKKLLLYNIGLYS
jgi:hypothetical protein